MSTGIVTDKFELALPPDVREALRIEPGDEIRFVTHEGRVELKTAESIRASIRAMRGIGRGMNADIEREDGDRA